VAIIDYSAASAQSAHSNRHGLTTELPTVLQGSAEPITKALKKKLSVSRPFAVATKDDVSKAVVLISCMDHDKQGLPYACMYVLSLNGAAFKTFMGGGLYLAMTPDDMATNFLKSIAQDIVERFESTNKENLRDSLKSCLFLTDNKVQCANTASRRVRREAVDSWAIYDEESELELRWPDLQAGREFRAVTRFSLFVA
jgi:hypothetical protein